MKKINYTELFYSLQGEGKYAGVPSVFFRTFGCNFRCKKFGRDRNEVIDGHNPEVVEVIKNIDKYKTFADLPLAQTGCDTYASIYPEFKRFNEQDTTDVIAAKMVEIIPNNHWQQDTGNDVHLVITGGEPLLGWQRAYGELLGHDCMKDLRKLTFETNGTQKLTPEFKHELINWVGLPRQQREVTFSVSAKLPCSGESWEEAICPEVVVEYQEVGDTYLKFVVATREDVEDAKRAVAEYNQAGFKGPVYLMPVGGVPQVYNLNTQEVARLAMEMGWRYSPRLQVDIWRNAWGT